MNVNLKKLISGTRRAFFYIRDKLAPPKFGDAEQISDRKTINFIFRLRDKVFFNKKKATSLTYPFTVIDPFEVFGAENLIGDFNLVGDEWRNKESAKPVALLWGFNNWKWGFVSDYLPEYRTAFAPRKILGLRSLLAINKFPIKPEAFIFWGYTEPAIVRWYAQRNGISIFRMEDGFIRSSSLGASHSTPYSLVLDTKGLHYNPDEVSDIEDILNTHVFSEDELASAQRCMDMMKALSISKYNPPNLHFDGDRSVKTRKRVVVLGQVDNDMSIRMGNPEGWSMIELIRLAKIENADADILYRPHPDIYQGYQKSTFKKRVVEKICEITSPDIPLIEFLDSVDHVYTVTSLSGLEALLLGKKVTVVGAAFYSGWGLTDDRVQFPRRTKTRTVLELFTGVYLKYPRYLANLNDREIGMRAACLRIKADQHIETFNVAKLQKADNAQNIQALARTAYWPQLLFKKKTSANESIVESAINKIDFKNYLVNSPGRLYQIAFAYSLCGICKANSSRDLVITNIRDYLDIDILNSLLLDLEKIHPGDYIARQFAWLLAEVDDQEASLDILTNELVRTHQARLKNIGEESADASVQKDAAPEAPHADTVEDRRITSDQANILMEMLEYSISTRKIDDAIEIGKKLLLANYFASKVIFEMAKIADLRFDMASAKSIAGFGQHIDLYERNRTLCLLEIENYSNDCVAENPLVFMQALVKSVSLKPDKINNVLFLIKKFSESLNDEKLEEIFSSLLLLDNELSVAKAAGFIAVEKPFIAVRIIESLISQGESSESVRIAYSQALSYAGLLDKAFKVMEDTRKLFQTGATYRESLRLNVLGGKYKESLKILSNAERRKIDLGDMHPRKVYFGCRMVKEALQTFTLLGIKNTVATYYPDKYFHGESPGHRSETLIALAIFGPGDEIRFASIYNLLRSQLVQTEITISCEPRLLNLFSNSFPSLKFVPVARPRNSEQIDLKNYTNVPGSDLTGVIDNTAVKAIDNADKIMLVTDMLHKCLPSYEAFPGSPYLKHDESMAEYFRSQLPANTKLVGLSWRSSLTTHSRNEHYLTVEELEPIFKIDGVQYVNFQYDECEEELDWIEQRYPGKVINVHGIDHYNDFDSVAALMKCMDLLIAPATTVVELAGALGCKTWLLSNSSELHWRKIDQSGTDVWHNSITHVEGAILGNKETLVDQLHKKILEFSMQKGRIDRISINGSRQVVEML